MTTRLLRPFRAIGRLARRTASGIRTTASGMPPQEKVMLPGLVLVAVGLAGVDWRLAVGVPGAVLVAVALGFTLAPHPRTEPRSRS